ncbi:hypothetical protein [Metabacillus arenae]|uniref:Uncharacterized protein n=1 Tax=Metabacillus arenae TaxID=2771434 RepID=A0A926NJS7_9BACI|nr:hypothetical protein [Metabacillus arenae]MBD1379146.1 hypothetical protein [Metabacillus arenae]
MSNKSKRKSELLKLHTNNELNSEDLIDKIVELEEKVDQYEAILEKINNDAKKSKSIIAERFFEVAKHNALPKMIEEHRKSKSSG